MKEAWELLILIEAGRCFGLAARAALNINLNADHDLVRLGDFQRHPQLHLQHFETFLIT